MFERVMSKVRVEATMPGVQRDPDASRRRWRRCQLVTAALLAVWFAVTFGVAYFARALNGIVVGWPFSFWVAAQGALIVFLVLVCLYARWMSRLDIEYGTAESMAAEDETPEDN